MRSKFAVPLGIAGLLVFIAFGWFLSDDPAAGIATTEVGWTPFDEGMKLAKEQNKKILVDLYTDWCTWCKKMDADTYPNPMVSSELKGNYIAIKLNAESSDPVTFNGQTMTSAEFAKAVGVTGYPSTLFIDEDLQPITVVPGYAPPERFVKILTFFSGNHYKVTDFRSYLNQSGG
ncbi:MAG: DUF255 domain-containing protein [Bacteroidetes bacterium]|jgi:thioredoxin-related protein|nr:DUF255 domain-containing protein [Bacteroidota bacterium]